MKKEGSFPLLFILADQPPSESPPIFLVGGSLLQGAFSLAKSPLLPPFGRQFTRLPPQRRA